jgi:hypothetical protein
MLLLEHRHADGSWTPFEPESSPHDPAERDPERAWMAGQIYSCPRCDEQIRVSQVAREGEPEER